MQQFEASLDMMRNGCAPKFKVSVDILDKLRAGEFTENNNDLRVRNKYLNYKNTFAQPLVKNYMISKNILFP